MEEIGCPPFCNSPLQDKGTVHSMAQWFATYTRSRYEKLVARELGERDVECFLPLYEPIRRRNKNRSELPLFPGYVFVHIYARDRLNVLQVPGVVRLVSFNGVPAPVDDAEIETLRNVLTRGLHAEPYPYVKVGEKVEILGGPLTGLSGKVLRKNNRFRVILSVDLLERSIAVEVDAIDLGASPLRSAA